MAAILPFLPGLFIKHLDVRTLSVLVFGHSQEWESLDLVIRNIMGFCSEIYNNCKKTYLLCSCNSFGSVFLKK